MRGLLSPLIKLVVFLVVTAFATYVLGSTIANKNFGATNTYKANFVNAQGLNPGDDVRVAGVRVGTVSNIAIIDHNTAQVTFTVDKARPLPKSVEVDLRYRNLVGQRYLDVERGAGDSNSMLAPGATIPLSQTSPAVDLTVLFQGFKPLFQGLDSDQINQLSTEIIKTLQGEGGELELLLSTVADLTNSLADKDHLIGEVIDNLSSVLTTVGQHDAELSNLIIQLQGFVSGLAADRKTIGNAIGGVNNLATQTAGLLKQVRAPLARNITAIDGLVGVLNRNSATVRYVLQRLSPTVAALIRTGSYGSWFNFYLCSVVGTITLPGGTTLDIPAASSSQARCQ